MYWPLQSVGTSDLADASCMGETGHEANNPKVHLRNRAGGLGNAA